MSASPTASKPTTVKLGNFGRYSLYAIQFPSGRYGFVGTMPVALAEPRSYPTMDAAIAAYTTWQAAQS